MKEVYIVDAKRTAVGSYLGSLSGYKAHELGAAVISDLVKANNIPADGVDEVIMGQVLTGGQGQNPARQAAIKAGLDVKTSAMTINKVCGSGLKAIGLASDAIALGNADIVIAGGQESMSTAMHGSLIRQGIKMGDAKLVDLMSFDGLTDAFKLVPMGITAENVAEKYGISREQQDEFALESQKKASLASNNGVFDSQIVPLKIKVKKDLVDFKSDEFIRHDSSIELLQKLKAVFKENGTVTAGNASGINDGAAALILASSEGLKKYNLKPLAKVVGHASSGVDPDYMGIGPVEAVKKLLTKINWKINDLNLVEANEAFAAQALAVNKLLDWDKSMVNITGGSIAIGHPIGASGARITVTLLHNMLSMRASKGLASLCIGGGMGVSMGFELI